MIRHRLFLLLAVAVAVIAVGCSRTELSQQDQIDIYAAVIRQLAGPDDTGGGALDKPILYIIRQTNDRAGDPGLDAGEQVVLSDELQQGITAALDDLPPEIIWIDGREELTFDEEGFVAGGGVILTLGNIRPQSGGKVQVAGSIYFASLGAGGQTYVLARQGEEWVVTGNTGTQWIS